METSPLTRDLLAWIAREPRTYRQTLEVWDTHCPRLSIWEDTIGDRLVHIRAGHVEVTSRGEATLRVDESASQLGPELADKVRADVSRIP